MSFTGRFRVVVEKYIQITFCRWEQRCFCHLEKMESIRTTTVAGSDGVTTKEPPHSIEFSCRQNQTRQCISPIIQYMQWEDWLKEHCKIHCKDSLQNFCVYLVMEGMARVRSPSVFLKRQSFTLQRLIMYDAVKNDHGPSV